MDSSQALYVDKSGPEQLADDEEGHGQACASGQNDVGFGPSNQSQCEQQIAQQIWDAPIGGTMGEYPVLCAQESLGIRGGKGYPEPCQIIPGWS